MSAFPTSRWGWCFSGPAAYVQSPAVGSAPQPTSVIAAPAALPRAMPTSTPVVVTQQPTGTQAQPPATIQPAPIVSGPTVIQPGPESIVIPAHHRKPARQASGGDRRRPALGSHASDLGQYPQRHARQGLQDQVLRLDGLRLHVPLHRLRRSTTSPRSRTASAMSSWRANSACTSTSRWTQRTGPGASTPSSSPAPMPRS